MYDIIPGDPMEVGFRRIRARRRGRVSRRPMSPRTAGPGIVAGGQRGGILGLGSVVVPQAASAILQTTVQKPFQGERLVITAAGVGVLLDNFQVGVTPQLAGLDGSPVEIFAADAVNVDFDITPCGAGTDVRLTLTNPTGADIVVSAGLIGVRGE